ncbi:unnamed protein product [Ascophyllum nodosum]
MVDYSRFNHIGSDSEDDVDEGQGGIHVPSAIAPRMQASTTKTRSDKEGSRQGDAAMTSSARSASEDPVEGASSVTSGSLPQPIMMTASKKGKEGRIKFEHEGRTVYEWEQSLEEVNLYIEPPPGLKADQIDCTITPRHLRLGIKGNPPFIDEDTGGPVIVEESYWMMDGGELNVNLQKMKKAETWPAALQGKNAAVDPATLEGMQKKIMLERFQSENPGFDFSGAEFNGQVPDARTFMGGVKYA